jgi:hypothetical protein
MDINLEELVALLWRFIIRMLVVGLAVSGVLGLWSMVSCSVVPDSIRARTWPIELGVSGTVVPWEDDHECGESGCDQYPIVTIRDGKPVEN